MPDLPLTQTKSALLALAASSALLACSGPEAPVPASAGPTSAAEGAGAAREASAGPARTRPPSGPRSESGPVLDARLELTTAGKPEGLLALDLDRDGSDELIVLARTPGRLSILSELPRDWELNARSSDLTVSDYCLGPVALGAGTDEVRLVIASRSTDELILIDPLAEGGPRVTHRQALGSAPRAITSGRLNDGLGERVVVATAKGELLHWNGEAHATAIHERAVSCLHLLEDGSGVLLGDQSERSLALYAVEGSPQPSGRYDLPGMPRALLELDLDASGDTELIVAGGDRSLWIFGTQDEGGPLSWFHGAAPLQTELDRIPLRLTRGDVSGDGRDEAIALFFGQLSYRVLALGAQEPQVARGYAGQAPWDIEGGDFDGDGRLDLAFANRDARRVGLLYGAPRSGLRTASRFATGRAPHSLATLNSRAAGERDLAVIHSLEDTWAVYSRGPRGWSSSNKLPAGAGANHMRAVDLDRDGQDDLLWTSTDAQGCRLQFATRPGGTSARALPAALSVGRTASDIVVADLDGDGLVEVVVCDEQARALRWVHFAWDDAAQSITTTLSSLELPAAPTCAVSREVDGKLELLVGCAATSAESGLAGVRVQAGKLVLHEFTSTTSLPIDLALADANGDGAQELILLAKPSAMDNGGLLEVWMRGEQWVRVASQATGQRPYAVVAGDWSGDGKAELAVSAQNSHNVGLWTTKVGVQGRVSLVRQADLGAGLGPLDLLLEDVDADGWLELIVAGAFSDDVTLISRAR